MKKDITQRFGNRIRELRNEKGYSQEELADKAGFHRTYIGMIERGERNPALKNIEVFSARCHLLELEWKSYVLFRY